MKGERKSNRKGEGSLPYSHANIYLTTRITCHSRLTLEKRKEEMGVGAQRKIHFVKLSR